MSGSRKSKPPEGDPREDDSYPSDVDIIAMTIRHGAEHMKQYLNAIALERVSRGIDDEQAEILPFLSAKEPKP
jgi:hypothetical protein